MDQQKQPRFGFYLVIVVIVSTAGYYLLWGYFNTANKNETFVGYFARVVPPIIAFVVAGGLYLLSIGKRWRRDTSRQRNKDKSGSE